MIVTTIAWTLFVMKKISDAKQPEISVNKEAIVTKLTALKNVETISMEITKVYEWKEKLADIFPQWEIDDKINSFLFKDNVSLIYYANVKAGFDLSQLKAGAIKVNSDKTISLTLAQPVILGVEPTTETRTFDRSLWVLTKWNQELETKIRNEAQDDIKDEAIKKWIYDQAKEKAKSAFEAIFSPLGYTIKDIKYENNDSVL